MASTTDENVSPVNIQETTSPVKSAICSPSLKASSLLTPSTEAESPDSLATPEFEEEACQDLASALPHIEVVAEEAETSTEEDVAWMQYLPKLGLEKAPTSWIADALLAETMEAECDLAVLRDFPQVHQPSWLFQSSSSEMPRPSYLVRSPRCDASTKAAAFSKLAQESDEEESDEEDHERQAAFSKLKEKCAVAATSNVAREVNKAKWHNVLSNTCVDNFDLELLEHIEPPRFTTV